MGVNILEDTALYSTYIESSLPDTYAERRKTRRESAEMAEREEGVGTKEDDSKKRGPLLIYSSTGGGGGGGGGNRAHRLRRTCTCLVLDILNSCMG